MAWRTLTQRLTGCPPLAAQTALQFLFNAAFQQIYIGLQCYNKRRDRRIEEKCSNYGGKKDTKLKVDLFLGKMNRGHLPLKQSTAQPELFCNVITLAVFHWCSLVLMTKRKVCDV